MLCFFCYRFVLIVQNEDGNWIRHKVGMKLFFRWIQEGEEQKEAFENSVFM